MSMSKRWYRLRRAHSACRQLFLMARTLRWSWAGRQLFALASNVYDEAMREARRDEWRQKAACD